MNYRFHPAAEAEHLEQITFYESRQRGLGARYREHFLHDIHQRRGVPRSTCRSRAAPSTGGAVSKDGVQGH